MIIILLSYVGMSFDIGYASWENYSGRVLGFSSTFTGEKFFFTYSFDNINLTDAKFSMWYTKVSPGLKWGEDIWFKGNINLEYIFWMKSYTDDIVIYSGFYPATIWTCSLGGEFSIPVGVFRIGVEGIYRFLLGNFFNVNLTIYIGG